MNKARAYLPQADDTTIPRLATPRLLLRGWTESDIEPYVAVCQSEPVMEFIGSSRVLSRAEVVDRLASATHFWQRNGFGIFAVSDHQTGSFIGMCGLSVPSYAPQVMPSVEIGWRFGEAHWGQGFATEAATAIIDWGFATHTFDSLIAIIQQGNRRCIRVATKLGMAEQLALDLGQPPIRAVSYRISRAGWNERVA